MKQDKYKELWKKLKSDLKTVDTDTNKDMLLMMNKYENEYELKHKKIYSKTGRRSTWYPIKISTQPWHHIYTSIRNLIGQRSRRNALDSDFCKNFYKEFREWVYKIDSKEKTSDELKAWLTLKHKELKYAISSSSKIIKKPKFTVSGFEKKIRSKLTEDEKASIVIDNLIEIFIPQIPNEYNLDIERYKEDWKQELWLWCWQYRNKEPNLYNLILNYNALPANVYKVYRSSILSKMNRYIISYIAKLQYSCNEIARYNLNEKYKEEVLYPSDNINKYNYSEIDLDTMIIESNSERHKLVEYLINTIGEYEFKDLKSKTGIYQTRAKQILKLHYGINSENRSYTLQEIGQYFGISKERVRQIEVWALRYIQKVVKYKKLDINI